MSLHLVVADVADLHEMSEACACSPLVEARLRPDGTYGRVVDHRGSPTGEKPDVEE